MDFVDILNSDKVSTQTREKIIRYIIIFCVSIITFLVIYSHIHEDKEDKILNWNLWMC
jgi:hypothetical protein